MYKFLVIGCGNIFTSFHYPILKKQNQQIIGIVEPRKESYNIFCEKENVSDVSYFEDVKDVNFAKIDIVLICSPSAFHAETIDFLLSKNVSIFCEKPILTDYKSHGTELKNKLFNYSETIQIGYYRRFSNATNYVKYLIDSELFGQINSVNMKGGWPAKSDLPNSITDKKLSGGGITMDYGSHFIDHCLFWFNNIDLEYYADDSEGGIEVNSQIKLKHISGFPIQIDLSWTNFMGNFIQLNFEKAIVFLGFNNPNDIEIIEINFQSQNILLAKDISKKHYETTNFKFMNSPAESQWEEFYSRMNGGKELVTNLNHAFEVSRIISECYEKREKLVLSWGN
jgi:predicted dehydrogenase